MDTRIGVHIIIKNESELLPQCLESVKDADEIIVVDTGSDDGSDEIAKAYGAKVIYEKWDHSFSAPRNEALRYAATDWIIYVDADECLIDGVEAIRTLLQNSNAEAYSVLIENVLGPSLEDRLFHRAVRIFRSGRGFAFRGAIHEDIGQSIVEKYGAASIQDSSLLLRHYGYLPQRMSSRNKMERNEALLKKELAEQPLNPFYLYHMGITCCQGGRLEEAKAYMSRALVHTPDSASFRPTLVRDLIKILIEQQSSIHAEMMLRKELRTYPDYAELYFLLGQALEIQGHFEAALEAFHNAVSHHNDHYVTEAGISSYRSLHKIGENAARLGRYEASAQSFYQALQAHRTYHPSLMGIADAFQQLDVSNAEIASLLLTLVQPQSSSDYAAFADALYRIGAFQECIASIPVTALEDSSLRLRCTLSLIQLGRFAEAKQWLSAATSASDQEQTVQLRSICQWQLHGRLRETALPDVPVQLHETLCRLDRYLLEDERSDNDEEIQLLSELAFKLIRQAVSLQCLKAAELLSALSDECELVYAKELYRLGRTNKAAELLIALLHEQRLDEEGMFMIGEILYDKGHYLQAAEMFEGSLSTLPDAPRTRTAASLSYLQLAADNLRRAASSSEDQQLFADDLIKIDRSIKLLNRTGWHTEWTGYQRSVRHEATRNLFMHDSKE
ncbi:glycosyltransferase family 2 protein [Paenibacillus sp. UNC451MF]|uniref:glycosyltransferase family 2 protein n=1 Tax=Paenibacillus sp. UNC451MF TaxID=1449063 RepID=UPI00048A6B06|nr:glycosyltransferase family 2 protein [Paenibacillus sp. UNC451MF]